MITHDMVLDMMVTAYAETQKSWGGCTINLNTLEWVPDGIDAYACAVTPSKLGPNGFHSGTIEIPESATFAEFEHAVSVAVGEFKGTATYLGIFHDDKKGTIDFDAVEVVATTEEVDALHKIRPVVGGAYNFATGDGYWPQLDDADIL